MATKKDEVSLGTVAAADSLQRYVVEVAGIARILPRDWDGRRLLQFLAGLALIALSFGLHPGVGVGPAAPPVAAHAAASAPGAPAPGSSASGSSASGSSVEPSAPEPAGAATTRHPTTATVAGAAVGRPAAPDSSAQVLAGPVHSAAPGTAVRPRAAGDAVLPVGAARGVLGSRAPPRG